MASYRLLIKPSAVKELAALALKARRKLVATIQGLGPDPRPSGSEKLSSQERYRIRQGDYRAIHSIDDNERSVLVVKIGHRGDVYRKWPNGLASAGASVGWAASG